jgi:hypothetical protein
MHKDSMQFALWMQDFGLRGDTSVYFFNSGPKSVDLVLVRQSDGGEKSWAVHLLMTQLLLSHLKSS